MKLTAGTLIIDHVLDREYIKVIHEELMVIYRVLDHQTNPIAVFRVKKFK